ncbi:Heterokaryon incompatibility protein 6, OR allele [Metarhizium anisopliae]|nr:Heterokaryon incompatibility protein 6, OR allele [Metarhizium anisopliae]
MRRSPTQRSISGAQIPSTHESKRPEEAANFPYAILDTGKPQFRLLEVQPGKPQTEIVGRLFHACLDENSGFEALSYTWGSPPPTYDISINGCAFPVAGNLIKALDDLRYPDKPRILWADAICINQRDSDEKAHQVKLMRVIFAKATAVCAWLGHSVQAGDSSFDSLCYLGKGIELDSFADPSYWYPVAGIFRNPYWRRLWIQQELILAKEVTVYCHRDAFSGCQLLEFQQRVNQAYFQPRAHESPLLKLCTYMNDQEDVGGVSIRERENMPLGCKTFVEKKHVHEVKDDTISKPPFSSLLQLFLQSGTLNMAEPRDQLYGILGLIPQADESQVRVDYNAPVGKVHSQVFSIYLSNHNSLDFLCFSRKSVDVACRGDTIPTWMPNAPTIHWSQVCASQAAGSTTASAASIDPKSLSLSVQGLLLDKIAFVAPRQDFDKLPILEWFSILESYCTRLWPSDPQRPLCEKKHVTLLLFPWLSKERYREMWKVDRPTSEERRRLLRNIRGIAAENDAKEKLTMRHLALGQFDLTTSVSCDRYEAFDPVYTSLSCRVLAGTENGRLGTLHHSAKAEEGDQVWILHGCRMPMILRPVPGNKGRFTLVGWMLLPGVMHGEAYAQEHGGQDALHSSTTIQIV